MPLAGVRVLLVEDEMLIAMTIEDILVEAGCDVVGPIVQVDRALDLLREDRGFDVAVMDLNLDGRSAVPVADLLAGIGIPFVVVTGYGAKVMPTPHDGVPILPKPFTPGTLTDAVSRLLGSRAGDQEGR